MSLLPRKYKLFDKLLRPLVILVLAINSTFAQINLVHNGDFEQHTACPFDSDQIQMAVGWDTLRAGGGGSPEYLHLCSPSLGYTIPNNVYGYQPAKSGNGYSSLFCYTDYGASSTQREYLQGELLAKLESGKTYCVTFYLNLGYSYSRYAIDRMGAYLDDGTISTTFYGQSDANPQVETQAIGNGGNYLSDTLNWVRVQGVFVSNGTEEYISIGNFQDYNHTSVTEFGGCADCGTYYYIDDVSVIEINSQANAGPDQTLYIGDSAFIGIPEVGDEFTWYANGTPFHTGSEAGLWVTPEETTTYVCEQHVCNVVTRDTVVVTVEGIGLQNEKQNENEELKFYPNPSTGVVYIKSQHPSNSGYQVRVYDAAGRLLRDQVSQPLDALQLPDESGVYFVEITNLDTQQTLVRRIELAPPQ